MTNKLIISFILILSVFQSSGQIKTVGPIEFRCNDILYSIRYGVWSDPIQNCDKDKYNFYSNTVNFNDISKQDSLIIEGIKEKIKVKGGQEFYSKLIFQNILISQRPKKM